MWTTTLKSTIACKTSRSKRRHPNVLQTPCVDRTTVLPTILTNSNLLNCLLFLGVLNFAYFKFCFSWPLQQSAVEVLVQPTSLLFHPLVNCTWMMQPLPSIVPVDMKWREKEHQPSMPPVNQMDPGQIFKTAQVILYLEEPPHAAVDLETLVKRSAL